jgi:hypothetical protein
MKKMPPFCEHCKITDDTIYKQITHNAHAQSEKLCITLANDLIT